jgi:hypothetical protein
MIGVPERGNLEQLRLVRLVHARVLKLGSNLAMTCSSSNLDQSILQVQATIEVLNVMTCA